MAEKKLTHKDLAKALNVSETTIKSYRRKFADCIPVASKGKPIRFTDDALAVCLRIRDLFDTGMSVDEVRARLAREFSWIGLVAAKPAPAGPQVSLPQEFTASLSNLAKSMVTLTRQQETILGRIRALENALEALPAGEPAVGGETAPPAANAAAEGDSGVFSALPVFGGLSEDAVRALLREALAPLGCLDEVRDLVGALRQAADKMALAAGALRDVAARPSSVLRQSLAQEQPEHARVIPFPGTSSGGQRFSGAEQPFADPPESAAPAAPVAPVAPADPPRNFLLVPLVVRTAGGAYISAGGKSGGRFTLNDLKALLVHGRRPPEHYTLHWEQAGAAEWRLSLEQPASRSPRPLQILVKESVSQRGISVAEIVQCVDAGQTVHPAEFCAFAAGLSEA